MRLATALFALCGVLSSARAVSDDLSHISNEELLAEIAARSNDIERTAERVAILGIDELEHATAAENARTTAREVDERLVERAGLLYRISQRGRALRFLLAAESATEFLKRLETLRRLMLRGLDERREAGLRAAEAEARLASSREQLRRAREMLDRLRQARDELLAEQAERAQPSLRLSDS
jgi:hypothetical protein